MKNHKGNRFRLQKQSWGDISCDTIFSKHFSSSHHNNSPRRHCRYHSSPVQPSITASMIAGIDDLMRIFGLLSEVDRKLFSDLCTEKALSAGNVSCDPSIVAALLVSTIKSLAAPVNSLIKITNGAGNDNVEISEDSVALRYLQYQRLMNLPFTIVQIIEQQCSDAVGKFEGKPRSICTVISFHVAP